MTSIVLWTAVGAGGTALSVSLFGPHLFGGSSLTVMSGSMAPAIRPGDVVIDQRIRPTQARVGDIVTFTSPGEKKLITHRIGVAPLLRIARVASFVTRGDAANGVQKWSIPASGSIGLVRTKVPKLGYAMWWVRTPFGRLACLVIPAIILGLLELRRIWLPRRGDSAGGREGLPMSMHPPELGDCKSPFPVTPDRARAGLR